MTEQPASAPQPYRGEDFSRPLVFGRVIKCGHKFHPTDEPDTNCASCWSAYFMEQKGIRIGVDSIIRSFGIEQLRKVRGNKFAKMYMRFVAAHPVEVRGDKVAA
jgi:hypothetical protein